MRGALPFTEVQDVITAAAVALGVPGVGTETSTEKATMTSSWRKLHGRWNPCTTGRAREILSPTQTKLLELMGAIEKMEDLVRRFCCRQDAQGDAHTLAQDIRMSSLEALLPDDLEKHMQMNRARLTSSGVLREEIKNILCV